MKNIVERWNLPVVFTAVVEVAAVAAGAASYETWLVADRHHHAAFLASWTWIVGFCLGN